MDAYEELLWRVLERIDPWGQTREDFRHASLCAAVMDSTGAKKENGDRFTAADFLPRFIEGEKPMQTPEQIESYFQAFATMHNLKIQLEQQQIERADKARAARLARLKES